MWFPVILWWCSSTRWILAKPLLFKIEHRIFLFNQYLPRVGRGMSTVKALCRRYLCNHKNCAKVTLHTSCLIRKLQFQNSLVQDNLCFNGMDSRIQIDLFQFSISITLLAEFWFLTLFYLPQFFCFLNIRHFYASAKIFPVLQGLCQK